MNSCDPSSCARRIFDIAGALCRAVGNAIGRDVAHAVTAWAIWRRILRARGILLALEARFLAGETWPDGVRRDARAAVGDGRKVYASGAGLPRRFGWLCGLVPGEAACFAGQLRGVLAEPGMAALLAACPQALRAVQPLCRMLGIAPADYVPAAGIAAPALVMRIAASVVPPAVVAEDAGRLQHSPGMAWVRFIPG